MRVVGNVLYLLTGGILLVFGWLLAALLCWFFVVTRRLVRPSFQIAGLCLWPAGRSTIRQSQVESYRTYIRTGMLPAGNVLSLRGAPTFEVIVWLPMGMALSAGHLVHGLMMLVPVFTARRAKQDFGLVVTSLFPFDVAVTPSALARAMRQASRPNLAQIRDAPKRAKRVALSAPWRLAIMLATALVVALWAPVQNQQFTADKIAEEGTSNRLGFLSFLSKAQGRNGSVGAVLNTP